MVKNHSRKTKKRGGRKYHIGGGDHNDAIPYEPVFYEDNDLKKENLYRLQAVKFPFKPQKNEDFKVPRFIIYEMI